jgi:hypothetical protein
MKKTLFLLAVVGVVQGSVYSSAKARLLEAIKNGRQIVLLSAADIPKQPVSKVRRVLVAAETAATVYVGYQVMKPLLPSLDDVMQTPSQKKFLKECRTQWKATWKPVKDAVAEFVIIPLFLKSNDMCAQLYIVTLFSKETGNPLPLPDLEEGEEDTRVHKKRREEFFQAVRERVLQDKNDPVVQQSLKASFDNVYSNPHIYHFSWIDRKNLVLEKMVAKDLGLDIEIVVKKTDQWTDEKNPGQ